MSNVTYTGPHRVRLNHTFFKGDRVEGGSDKTCDYDTGTIVEINGDRITVSWDSMVETTQHYCGLQSLEE